MIVRFLGISLGVIALTGCPSTSDLGSTCPMVKRNPDGGRALTIKEGEIKVGANKDFISFGTTNCENLTCVRDSDFFRTDGGSTVDPNTVAEGYCSDKCQPGSACPAQDPKDDTDAKRRLNCRPLLLDEETLKALCASGQCLPGGIKSPYFCARGAVPDGGG